MKRYNDNEEFLYEHQVFNAVDYSEQTLENVQFYKCKFERCDFSKSNVAEIGFEDCIFEGCNFTMTKVKDTGFRNASFKDCRVMGVNFAECSKFMFSFSFERCILDYSVFLGRNIKETSFIGCSLKEVNFSEANLTSCIFTNSDLTLTRFSNTILEKADFRGAFNFAIDPEFNKMKKAKFHLFQLEGLLYKYQLDIEHP